MDSIAGAYVYFCDDNRLKRIDATPEEHLANLDKMAMALLKARQKHIEEIAARCEQCGGSGKKDPVWS
jgi:hypothetical protein